MVVPTDWEFPKILGPNPANNSFSSKAYPGKIPQIPVPYNIYSFAFLPGMNFAISIGQSGVNSDHFPTAGWCIEPACLR